VYSLAVSGSTVYAGGEFSTIGGQERYCIAAIDASTGSPTSWNPDVDGTVYSLAVSSSTVYAGGDFTDIGGQARNYIAAIDASGNATSWNPNADYTVRSLAVSSSTVYAGGDFTTIGGQERYYIAAINASGNATSWNPDANGTVYSLAVSGSTVYAGGAFTTIGGQTRNYIAAIDASGNATSWNPNADYTVCSLAVSGSTVYAGGDFTTIGGQERYYIAAINASGNVTSWNPDVDGIVYSLAVSGSTVYAGGDFTTIGGQERYYIAAIDASTGSPTSWNPDANGIVYAIGLSYSNAKVYVGGEFSNIFNESCHSYIAGLSNPADTSLPVTLSLFTAGVEDGAIILRWRTETEVGNVGFGLYRSETEDGNYTEIAFVRGVGDSGMPNDYQFLDKGVEEGKTYFYFLEDVDIAGERNRTKIIEVIVPLPKVVPLPKESRLLQNFPNPFNPETWIPYQLASSAPVRIYIYNIHGELVRELNVGKQEGGYYITKEQSAYWDGRNSSGEKVASGVYFYRMEAGEFRSTRKMVIMK
jgi:hypothetical protein